MRISSVAVYPVKSGRGLEVSSAAVELAGLRHDRRWMVVDPAGEPVTARTDTLMFTIAAQPADDGSIVLSTPGRPPLHVPTPGGEPDVDVQLSRLPRAVAAGRVADAWLSAVLERPVRLVWLDDPARRPVGTSHGGRPGDPLTLADAGPLLLATTASLRQLETWIGETGGRGDQVMSLARFRPNVIVDSDNNDLEPFAEDRWQRVTIGNVDYRFGECCDRCVMTTIDPDTLSGGKEPIRTLARHRRWDGKVWFGVRLIPLGTGRVAVGDQVVPTV